MTHRTFLLVAILFVSSTCASISFLDKTWTTPIQSISMEHVLNIFRHDLGEATSTDISKSVEFIKAIVNKQSMPQKIQIYLADVSQFVSTIPSIPISNYVTSKIPSKVWANVASYTNSTGSASTISVIDADNININDVMMSHQTGASRVIIWATPEEHKPVKSTLSQPKRLLQTSTDSSYLIKFFFSILFLIVTFAVLSATANMSSQRDSLLYAKFIADVGTR